MTTVAPQRPTAVEDRVRLAALARRLRTTEYFKDFDKLRTGYITNTQFQRCLNVHFGVNLTEDELKDILQKYDLKKNGMVNYRQFCAAVEKAFNPLILDGKPQTQPIPKLATSLQYTPGQPTQWIHDDADMKVLLQRCQQYYKYQGIKIRSCYEDFDRHNRGLVTESQFHRSFPGPADVTEHEMRQIAGHYRDPKTGLYNYLRFHADIELLGQEESDRNPLGDPRPPSAKVQVPTSVDDIFARIRDVVYKNGIRTTEFFKDHDKLRSGVITENQFICGLSLCCGQLAHLSREEIQMVVEHFKTKDGSVRYKGFCDIMENSYNVPNMEKNPTVEVFRPLQGQLSRQLNVLSEEEESKVEEVLKMLRNEVKKRRLLLYPYYRDFDRGKGYTRGVTKPQFERLLHFLSLKLPPNELKLIEKKFENPIGGDMNYSAFIQAIDEEYTGQVVEAKVDLQDLVNTKEKKNEEEETARMELLKTQVNVSLLLDRIREHVETNRIRVMEHFQDFDPLRSGSISNSRFRQGLTAMGQPYLRNEEVAVLCERYSDPKKKYHVLWKCFLAEIDRAHGEAGLELTPTKRLTGKLAPPPKVGALDWEKDIQEKEKDLFEAVMYRLREQVTQRRILAKPCFQDFDKHHHGYVTFSQFSQCMSYLQLHISADETSVIKKRFGDSKGFNYISFLAEIQPSEKLEDKYQERMTQLVLQKTATLSTRERSSVNVEQVLDRMKSKVYKERIRVLEFLHDYDKLRSHRMLATSFRRALDLCGFKLSQSEIEVLEDRYRSPRDPNFIEYKAFSDEMESIFTIQDLEKMPTVTPQFYVPPVLCDAKNTLQAEEDQILERCMHRLAERVRVRRIQIMTLFEDYDKVHIGSVTKSQFHRVLSELELGGLVNEYEFGIIFRKFATEVGGFYDVNYIEFSKMIDDFAQTRWDDPLLK